jgi:hypothetical protein
MNTRKRLQTVASALLVEPAAMTTQGQLDAIVVPSARPARMLNEAISLAASTEACLVVISSHNANPRDAAAALRRAGQRRWMVIDFTARPAHPLLVMKTDRIHEAVLGRSGVDQATKRNFALLLARLTGWGSIAFLDDDVSGLQASLMPRAVGTLDRFELAGWRVTDFPDNSVVRHAYRLTDDRQDVFISGGALLVGEAALRSFFPSISNEDWFFMLPSLARRPAATLGTAKQLAYDPFDPSRAEREEFGDLIAEALLHHLIITGGLRPPSRVWWEHQKRERARFLGEVVARLGSEAPRATEAVNAARIRLRHIPPAAPEDWFTCWAQDLMTWERRLESLPRSLSPMAAAHSLELSVIAEGM